MADDGNYFIQSDEVYPVYWPIATSKTEGSGLVTIPQWRIDWIEKVSSEYSEVQDYLERLYRGDEA